MFLTINLSNLSKLLRKEEKKKEVGATSSFLWRKKKPLTLSDAMCENTSMPWDSHFCLCPFFLMKEEKWGLPHAAQPERESFILMDSGRGLRLGAGLECGL